MLHKLFRKTPYMTMEEAETYFKSFDGQGFHMHRENPDIYQAYKNTRITRQCEHNWRTELIDKYKQAVTETNSIDVEIWHLLSRICQLSGDIDDPQVYHSAYLLMLASLPKCDDFAACLLGETLMGSETGDSYFSNGVIYRCLESNYYTGVRQFTRLASQLLNSVGEGEHKARTDEALKRLDNIGKIIQESKI